MRNIEKTEFEIERLGKYYYQLINTFKNTAIFLHFSPKDEYSVYQAKFNKARSELLK